MHLRASDLKSFGRQATARPAPIEPALTVEQEIALLCGRVPMDDSVERRRDRVLALLRSPGVPAPPDAELICGLAAERRLPIETRKDRLLARVRLADIGRMSPAPPLVAATMRDLGLAPGDGPGLADRLLPATHDLSKFADANPTTGLTYGG